jgi:hypothetical protein
LYPEDINDDNDDDPFEGEGMMNLEQLCLKISRECSATRYIDADDYVPYCAELIVLEIPTWVRRLEVNF